MFWTRTHRDAEVFAMSAYKKHQNSERSRPNEGQNGYVCQRCLIPGHQAEKCFAINKKCKRCDKIGHYAQACTSSMPGPRSGTGHANAIRAYVEHLSPNDLAVFNAQQIEKAENCGLVYNVETNDVENPENMTRHQRAGMFGHLN